MVLSRRETFGCRGGSPGALRVGCQGSPTFKTPSVQSGGMGRRTLPFVREVLQARPETVEWRSHVERALRATRCPALCLMRTCVKQDAVRGGISHVSKQSQED